MTEPHNEVTVTNDTIFRIDLKILTGVILTVVALFGISSQVRSNSKDIEKISSTQSEHINSYQSLNSIVILANEKAKNNEKMLIEIRQDVKDLLKISNSPNE